MKCVVDMGSGAMIHIPSFIKIRLGIQKLMRRERDSRTQYGDLINLLLFFQNGESRLMKLDVPGVT
jgi:hypothetical protein